MHIRKSKLTLNSLYAKILFSSILLITASVGIVSSLLYNRFTENAYYQANMYSTQLLHQISYSADFLYEITSSFGVQLLSDNDVIHTLYSESLSEIDIHNINNKLSRLLPANPTINSVYLYNKKADRYIATVNTNQSVKDFDPNAINMTSDILNKRFTFIPRILSYKSSGKIVRTNILTFTLSDLPVFIEGVDSAIILNVSQDYLKNLINSMNVSKESTILILNKDGTILSHPDDSMFCNNISTVPYIRSCLLSQKESGYLEASVNHQRSLISYVLSPKLGWVFISITPYAALTKNIDNLKFIILLICFIVLLSGILASLLITKRIYSPVNKLLENVSSHFSPPRQTVSSIPKKDEIGNLSYMFSEILSQVSTLKEASEASIPILKNNFLRQLLTGASTDNKSIAGKFNDLNIPLDEHDFIVYLLRIDNHKDFLNQYDKEAQVSFKFNLYNSASEYTGSVGKNAVIEIDDCNFAVLLNTSGLEYNKILNQLISIMNKIKYSLTGYDFTVTAAIGDIVSTPADIQYSCESALNILKYRYIYGHDSILYKDRIKVKNRKFAYPYNYQNSLFEAIRLTDLSGIQTWLEKIIEYCYDLTYENAFLLMTSLTVNSLDLAKNLGLNYDENLLKVCNELEVIREVQEKLFLFYKELMKGLEMKKENKNTALINHILEYLKLNYGNPNISSDYVAELLGLSSQYFSRLFKEITGQNYSQYLTDLRFSKSKEFLNDSNLTIEEVAKKVGFNSQSYFTSKFKTYFGITPNQYRCENTVSKNITT